MSAAGSDSLPTLMLSDGSIAPWCSCDESPHPHIHGVDMAGAVWIGGGGGALGGYRGSAAGGVYPGWTGGGGGSTA